MKKQLIYTIIAVIGIAIVTVGGTYAFFMFTVRGATPINTNSPNFEISYVGGGSSFEGNIDLVNNKDDGYKKTLTIKTINNSVDAKLNLYLTIDSISSNMAISAFKWEVYGYNSNNQQVYSNSNNFNGLTTGAVINLVNYDYTLTSDATTFDIYLWLDINGVDNNVLGGTFRGHIDARTEQFTGILKQ